MALRIISQYDFTLSQVLTSKQESNKSFSRTLLFEKELTPSDVGKLNRLVIPKRYAVKYLPFIRYKREDNEREEVFEDVEIVFYDKTLKQWKFRYCYWGASQSFAFTRGWKSFVKEKNLKDKDIIVFYTCNISTNVKTKGQNKNLFMIDVRYLSDNSFVLPKEDNNTVYDSCEERNDFRSKLEDDKTKSGGFLLFGVRIQ